MIYKTNVNTKETSLINNLFERDITIFGGLASKAVVRIRGFIIR
ncbi:hypothetical protein [Paeniclostridium hominis]|nr:hypothetical protein [Paeniclostridium hominis]